MKAQSKSLRSKPDRHELIKLCNEKIIMAARDLAEFTKHGLYANFIVSLAQKCEDYERAIAANTNQRNQVIAELEAFLVKGILKICEKGMFIWSENPERYHHYMLPELPVFVEYQQASAA